MHPFEEVLSITVEDLEFALANFQPIEWANFWLNPRRLRGSDFLMRWSQGVWSEERLIQAVNETETFWAIPYGPSGVAPNNDVRAYELYFERLEQAGLGTVKRPDVLVFRKADQYPLSQILESIGGVLELPFIPENNLTSLIERAIIAVECENSLWKAKQMPNYGSPLTPQKRLQGKMGLKKSAVLPTIIIKEEDRAPLARWQAQHQIPLHIWHSFYDIAFGLSFNGAEQLIQDGLILPTEQTFQAPGGAVTKKLLYKFYYHYAYPLGDSTEEPTLVADHIVDKNGHILPYVRFEGGHMKLTPEALTVLDTIRHG
jgi:hypothetical protein